VRSANADELAAIVEGFDDGPRGALYAVEVQARP
jgi:hypothetical protein